MAAENVEVCFEEGKLRLPSHVLDEDCAINTKANMRQRQPQQQHYRLKSPAETLPQHLKYSIRSPHHRPKLGPKEECRGGGFGMQAFFLEQDRKSCGTGVFLPRRADANSQPRKKPACSPVLLPSRVVQALNLNVHALGLHLSPKKDTQAGKPETREYCNSNINKNGTQYCCVISQNRNSSQMIYLPKEWTY
ncbi:uncharacterized protein LOC132169069 [Corylus avellana]|uniref:uncharacterized protein LOC132169069 n=1 Tax=Corylus avellana TaxID=13451 RepID=UPI00286BC085|nr:uncharacterized protein LOC132169069 [Corylus avellana]